MIEAELAVTRLEKMSHGLQMLREARFTSSFWKPLADLCKRVEEDINETITVLQSGIEKEGPVHGCDVYEPTTACDILSQQEMVLITPNDTLITCKDCRKVLGLDRNG